MATAADAEFKSSSGSLNRTRPLGTTKIRTTHLKEGTYSLNITQPLPDPALDHDPFAKSTEAIPSLDKFLDAKLNPRSPAATSAVWSRVSTATAVPSSTSASSAASSLASSLPAFSLTTPLDFLPPPSLSETLKESMTAKHSSLAGTAAGHPLDRDFIGTRVIVTEKAPVFNGQCQATEPDARKQQKAARRAQNLYDKGHLGRHYFDSPYHQERQHVILSTGCPSALADTHNRLFVHPEKPRNLARSQNLFDQNHRQKDYDIVSHTQVQFADKDMATME